MPLTDVVFYEDDDHKVPVLAWLDELEQENLEARAAVEIKIELLVTEGHMLRFHGNNSAYLRDGLLELRARVGRVNYRVLYFFHQSAAVLVGGCAKEGKLPEAEIRRACDRRSKYVKNPKKYTYMENVPNA